MNKLRQFGMFLLISFLSTYLPQTIGLYVTIILDLGIDSYSIILTMELVLTLFLLVWWLQRQNLLFIFEKRVGTGQRSFTCLHAMW